MALPTVTFTARNQITIKMASSQTITDLPACVAVGVSGFVPPGFPLVTTDAFLTYHAFQAGSANEPLSNAVQNLYYNFSYFLTNGSYTTSSQNGGQQAAYILAPITLAYGNPQGLSDPNLTVCAYIDGYYCSQYAGGFYYETASYNLGQNNTGLAYVQTGTADGSTFNVVYDPAICPNPNYPNDPYSGTNYSVGSLFAIGQPSNVTYLAPFYYQILKRSDLTQALGNQDVSGNSYPIYTVNTVNTLGTYSTATIPGLMAAYQSGDMDNYQGIVLQQSYSYNDDYVGYLWGFQTGFGNTPDTAFEVSRIDGTIETPLSLIQFDDNTLLQWIQLGFTGYSSQPIAVSKDLFIFGTPTNYIMMDLRTYQYDVLVLTCDSTDTNAVTALSQMANSFYNVLAFGNQKAFAADGTLFALPYTYSGVLPANNFQLVSTAPSAPTIIIDRLQINVQFPTPLPFVPCCSLTCPC